MSDSNYTYQFYQTTEAAWTAMREAIGAAKRSIYWEIYIFIDDVVGNRFLDLLSEKARSGVQVKIIIDAFGSADFSEEAEKKFSRDGFEILKYNRYGPQWKLGRWLGQFLHRNHRKVLIVDEEVVFLGGVNVHAKFQAWDDLYLKISGPVARPLLRGFAKSYVAAGGKRKEVQHLLHPKEFELAEWMQKLSFIVHSPIAGRSKFKKMYTRALAMAKESVNLLTPYYVPNRQFLKALALAKQRGVTVNIFLPLRPDIFFMELLARTYYELTFKAGANIYFLPNMNHGKALSVDNKLGLVGSYNFIPHSFARQEESGVTFTDEEMVKDLNILFNNLKSSAQPFNLERWQRRGSWHRIREWLAKKFEYFV